MKISAKLLSASLIPLLFLTFGTLFSLVLLVRNNNAASQVISGIFERQVLIAEVYDSLGYGKGIHAFKNYVLRGDQKYLDTSVKEFNFAVDLIQQYLQLNPISVEEEKALNKTQDLSLTIITIAFLISIAFAFVASQLISTNMIRSIRRIIQASKKISDGDYVIKKDYFSDLAKDELKTLAEQLAAMSENLHSAFYQLKRSNEDLEQFTFIASHDLQEPIKKISNFTDILSLRYADSLSADGKIYIDKIKTTSSNMIRLIHALLDFSRVANTKFNLEEVNLENTINSVLKTLELSINESNAIVSYENLPKVTGNKDLLEIVFYNLISNGIKFRKENSTPHINIYAEKINGRSYKITVEDNGIGFDNRYAEKILKPFGRAHDKIKYPGSGIGLALCKRILAAHRSEIYVESTINVGSKFSFILPKIP